MECKELRHVHLDFFDCSHLSEATAVSSDKGLTECEELEHRDLESWSAGSFQMPVPQAMECKELRHLHLDFFSS